MSGATLDLVQHVNAAFNTRRLDQLGELFCADAEIVSPQATMRGPQEFVAYLQGGFAAFPDLSVRLVQAVGDGAGLAAEQRFTGTHTGTLDTPQGGLPPTGNRLAACELVVVDTRQGRISAWRTCYDRLPLLVAAGAAPAPPGGPVDHADHPIRPGRVAAGVDPATAVRRCLELFDGGDLDRALTRDCLFVHPAAVVTGPGGAAGLLQPFRAAFPDAGHSVRRVLAAGPTVVVEGAWAGTHTGTFTTPAGALAATGRRVEVPFALLATMDGDRLASVHVYTDQLAFLDQLGLTPAAKSA